MKIIAVDPGSIVCGIAYMCASVSMQSVETATARGRRGGTWLERLETICVAIRAEASVWPTPDIVAIEETVAFRSTVNVGFILARGYLIRFLSGELYPGVELLEVPLSTVRRAVGVKGNARREIRQAATRALFPAADSQDAADAAAVALAAASMIAELRAQAG